MIDHNKLNVSICYHCEKEFNAEEIIVTLGLSFHTLMSPLNEHRYIGIQTGNLNNPTARFHESCFELISGKTYSFDDVLNFQPTKELYVGKEIRRPKP